MQWQDFLFNLFSPLLLCHRTGNRLVHSLSISDKTDEELVELINSAPTLISARFSDPHSSTPLCAFVCVVAADAIAKDVFADFVDQEYLSMEFVRNNTCIPVPKAERRIKALGSNYGALGGYIVQEFIPGDPLRVVWPTMSWWKRFRVALTLRYYIHQLRSLQPPSGPPAFPGPPTADGKPGYCTGRLFTEDGAGPFSSYGDLEKWYNNRLRAMERLYKMLPHYLEAKERSRGKQPNIPPFDASSALTFTHMDLHPRNIILGHDGQLWLIDWADAGWYPSWFEGASMAWWASKRPGVSLSWLRMLPFITGSSYGPGQLPFLKEIHYSLVRMRPNLPDY